MADGLLYVALASFMPLLFEVKFATCERPVFHWFHALLHESRSRSLREGFEKSRRVRRRLRKAPLHQHVLLIEYFIRDL